MFLPPLSAAPEAIAELYARCFGQPPAEATPAFARSVLATLDVLVACDFRVPRALFEGRVARPTAQGDTLHDVLARGTWADFAALAERTRQATFDPLPPLHDPFIWTLPLHIHLVRAAPGAPLFSRDDPDRADDLERFDPAARRVWATDRARFVADHERDFALWLARRNLSRLDVDFGPAGAVEAIGWLEAHCAPHSPFWTECIARVGSPGMRFRLVGVSDGVSPTRIGLSRTDWLRAIEPAPDALNLVITGAAAARRFEDEFAFFPQTVLPGPRWQPDLQRRALGLASLPADSLGFLRGPGRAFGRESGVTLTHELGHLFQLYHLGCERLHPGHQARDDFDLPAIGVAGDTLWQPGRVAVATLRPERALFAHTLHGRSMYMNFMAIAPKVDDGLFFTRGQAARARAFARLHYGALIERGEPWPEVERFVGPRDQTPERLLASRFDAADPGSGR